jgi:hypothetical protein
MHLHITYTYITDSTHPHAYTIYDYPAWFAKPPNKHDEKRNACREACKLTNDGILWVITYMQLFGLHFVIYTLLVQKKIAKKCSHDWIGSILQESNGMQACVDTQLPGRAFWPQAMLLSMWHLLKPYMLCWEGRKQNCKTTGELTISPWLTHLLFKPEKLLNS